MSMADPETEDWTQITEPRLRKRVQNRLSQRKHSESSPFLTAINLRLPVLAALSRCRRKRIKINSQSQGQSLRQQRKGSLEAASPSSQTTNTRPGNSVPRLAASSSRHDPDEWNPHRSNIEHAKRYTTTPKTVDFERWDGIDSFSSEVLETPDLSSLSCDASSQISSWPTSNNITPRSRRPVDPPSSIMAEPGSFLPPPAPPPSPALAQTGPTLLARTVKNSFPASAPAPAPASASAPVPAPAQWSLVDIQQLDSMPRMHSSPLTCNPSTLSTSATMSSAATGYGLDPRIYSCCRHGVQAGPRRSSNHLDNVMQSPLGLHPSSSSPLCLNTLSDTGRRGPERYESLRPGNGHAMLRI